MIRFIAVPLQYQIVRQLIKFGIVGSINTAVDFLVYLVLTRWFHIHYLVAASMSWIVALCSSYLLNKYWTFRATHKAHLREVGKFIIVNIGSYSLTIVMMYMLVSMLFIHDLVAKLMTALLTGLWNFSLNKFWTFKRS